MINKFFVFVLQLGKKTVDDDLFSLSNELAYKILLSFFPFLIFLVTLLGFLRLEDSPVVHQLFELLPDDIGYVIENFVTGLQAQPQAGLLSFSLLVSMYSASNGFKAIVRGVNKAHGYHDGRSLLKKTALSLGLMLIFTFSIITMLVLWIFSDAIIAALQHLVPFDTLMLVRVASAGIALAVLIGTTSWMYYLACAQRGECRIFPGACATVALWAISSNIFGIYISRFTNISLIYGSLAGIFILIIWINLISFFLLFGNTINALLNKKDKKDNHHSPL